MFFRIISTQIKNPDFYRKVGQTIKANEISPSANFKHPSLSLYKRLININSVRGTMACGKTKYGVDWTSRVLKSHAAFVYFLFAEISFSFLIDRLNC